MAKVKVNWRCLCDEHNPIIVRKPGFFGASIVHSTCTNCKSYFMVAVSRIVNSKQVDVEAFAERPTKMLLDIVADREKKPKESSAPAP